MPKYQWFLLAGWSLLNMPVQAQEKTSRWSIGLTAGPAFPVGAFANYHNQFVSPTGVNTGESAELFGKYRVTRCLSIALAFNGQLNHGAGIPYTLRPLYESEPIATNNGIKNDWQIARMLAGGVYSLPLSKHQGPALFIRMLAGVQKIRTPDYTYLNILSVVSSAYSDYITAPGAALHWVLSYEADAGIRWGLSKRVALLGCGGYSGSGQSKEASTLTYMCPNGGCTLSSSAEGSFVTGTIQVRVGAEIAL